MVHTFLNLQNQVLGWLDERTDDGTTRVNVRNAINTAHQSRLSMYPWPHMIWDRAEVLTLASSTQIYALHQEYSRPLYFRNLRTRELLVETPAKNFEASGVDPNNDQAGNRFMLWGRSPVKAQPAAASVLTIVSTSASDTGSDYALIIKGVTADDAVVAELVAPTGTTPVDSSNSFIKILSITKAREWNGTLTVTSDDGATTNLVLGSCEFGRQYPLIWLLYSPTSGDQIEYKFYRQPLILINDFDIPEIPAPFSQILVWDALLLLMAYDGQLDNPRIGTFRNQAQQLEDAMVEALWEGQSLGAEPRLIRERMTLETPILRF